MFLIKKNKGKREKNEKTTQQQTTPLFNKTIYIFSIKLSLSSIAQDKSKLQKQIRKLLILIETAAVAEQGVLPPGVKYIWTPPLV